MALDHDEGGSDDSDLENLETPSEPPEKPSSMIQFYIDHHRHSGLSTEELRQQFSETLGKQEKQRWKTKHKKARKRYHKLLQLYQDANPSFNLEIYQQRSAQQRSPTKRKRTRQNGSGGQRGTVDIYDSSFDPSPGGQPKKKKQKTAPEKHSIDDLFRDINAGTKRAIRDPDKFRPTDDHKHQMAKIVEQMREAARKDWECNRKGQPAINTLQLVEVVVAELSKKLFYKYYLDDTDLLEAIRDWIHPLPDGSLPALKIRTEMYRIIWKLELHDIVEPATLMSYLEVSEDKSKDPQYQQPLHRTLKGFSRTVMRLWAHPKEANSNKVLLRKIMEKWIRSLTGSDSNYSDLREEMRESQLSIQQRAKILQKQKGSSHFITANKKRATVPEKAWHDFAIMPQNLIDVDGDGNPLLHGTRTASHPMQDRMNKTFKKSLSSRQAAKPSITGRKTRK